MMYKFSVIGLLLYMVVLNAAPIIAAEEMSVVIEWALPTPGDELFDAIASGSWQDVQRLICNEQDLFERNGATPLHVAAQENRLDFVKKLLTQCGCDINRRGGQKIEYVTPLYLASQKGHFKIVQCLLQAGADVNVGGLAPLYGAAIGGQVDVVRLLIRAGAHPSARGNDGHTPFMAACDEGNLSVVVALAKHVDVNEVGGDGYSVAYYAAEEGHSAIIEFLKNYTAADLVSPVGDVRATPLIKAAYYAHIEAVRILIEAVCEAGADIDYAQCDGGTALLAAAAGGHMEIVELLLDAGADMRKKLNNGATILHVASNYGRSTIVSTLLRDRSYDVDPQAVNASGCTPLHLAAKEGHFDVVKVLIGSGADATKCNDDGDTPADVARAHGHDEIVAYLES